MNSSDYLKRIDFHGAITIDLTTLRDLHKCHLFNVPFENLDIQHQKDIVLTLEHLFEKVVKNRRGGFCYELNFLFHHLLVDLGFKVKLIAARIFKEDVLGPEFDHLALIVKLNGTNYLADVGFGDLFIKPLQIDSNNKQFDGRKYYKLRNLGKCNYLLYVSDTGNDFEKKYVFRTDAKKIEQFSEQCLFKQQAYSSYFVKNKIVTLPTNNGRKTIFNENYIVKKDGVKIETPIKNETDELNILKSEFNIEI